MGVNTNLRVGSIDYHVQTEDLGHKSPRFVTHVFCEGGVVAKVVALDYSHLLASPELGEKLGQLMKAFHAKVIRDLERRRLESIPPQVSLRSGADELSNGPLSVRRHGADCPRVSSANDQVVAPKVEETLSSVESECTSGPRSSEQPLRGPSNVWDRTGPVSQRMHEPASGSSEGARRASTGWDQAVRRAREEASGGRETKASMVEPDPAVQAYEEGMRARRKGELLLALTQFAQAVHLEPTSQRFRAALRRALEEVSDKNQ